MCNIIFIIHVLFLYVNFFLVTCNTLSVGSTTAPSVQAQTIFLASDTNNTALGFASFQSGFYLEDYMTTCTFNNEFPVQSSVGLWGGSLYLSTNLTFANPASFITTGKIYGNNNAIEWAQSRNEQLVPIDDRFYLSTTISVTRSYSAAVLSTDWAYDSMQLAVGTTVSASFPEFVVTFSGGNKVFVDTGRRVNAVAWNPTDYYVAYGSQQGAGTQVNVYYANYANSSLTLTASQLTSSISSDDVTSVAWNNTGSLLAAGKLKSSQIYLYSFNSQAQSLTELARATFPQPTNGVSQDSISFSPQANYLVVGTERKVRSTPLIVYDTSANSLTVSASMDPGFPVLAVDYSSTGSYVAVGLSGTTNNLQIYQHNPTAGTLTLITSASLGGSTFPGNTLRWNHKGNYVVVGTNTSGYFIFYFDQSALTLQSKTVQQSRATTNCVSWTLDGNQIALGQSGGNAPIVTVLYDQNFIRFDNSTLVFNSPISLGTTWKFSGINKIYGKNNILTIPTGTKIQLYPNSSLILQDISIVGLGSFNLECLTDSSTITIRDSLLKFSSDYTFSLGTLFFEEDVLFSGTVKFSYAGDNLCTIRSGAILYIDAGMTFSYSPSIPNKQLLFFEDQTAALYLNNCTLYSTITGLQITSGSLFFDNKITISSEARNSGEALILGSGVNTILLGGAFLDIFGQVSYL